MFFFAQSDTHTHTHAHTFTRAHFAQVVNIGLHFSDSHEDKTKEFQNQLEQFAHALSAFNQQLGCFGFLRDITPQHFKGRDSDDTVRALLCVSMSVAVAACAIAPRCPFACFVLSVRPTVARMCVCVCVEKSNAISLTNGAFTIVFFFFFFFFCISMYISRARETTSSAIVT